MSDSRLGRWVQRQLRTIDGETGFRAVKLCFERTDGPVVETWHIETPNLENEIEERVVAQMEELPGGPHSYKFVAYGPDGSQMSELPQTLRGRSREATGAATEATAMQRATALSLENVQTAVTLLRTELEAKTGQLATANEDVAAVLAKLNEMSSQNFDQQLKLQEFMRKQDRLDKMWEGAGGIVTMLGTMAAEKYGPKLMGMLEHASETAPEPVHSNSPEPSVPGKGEGEAAGAGGPRGTNGARPGSNGPGAGQSARSNGGGNTQP